MEDLENEALEQEKIYKNTFIMWCSKKPKGPKVYEVVSEPYEVSYNDYYEPPDIVVDYALVRASNARRAKVLAVRLWRRLGRCKFNYYQSVKDPYITPFKGLRAIKVCP